MSFQEYLKYLTRSFVQYVETPQEERRKHTVPRESWSSRWFGVIPMAIRMVFAKERKGG